MRTTEYTTSRVEQTREETERIGAISAEACTTCIHWMHAPYTAFSTFRSACAMVTMVPRANGTVRVRPVPYSQRYAPEHALPLSPCVCSKGTPQTPFQRPGPPLRRATSHRRPPTRAAKPLLFSFCRICSFFFLRVLLSPTRRLAFCGRPLASARPLCRTIQGVTRRILIAAFSVRSLLLCSLGPMRAPNPHLPSLFLAFHPKPFAPAGKSSTVIARLPFPLSTASIPP